MFFLLHKFSHVWKKFYFKWSSRAASVCFFCSTRSDQCITVRQRTARYHLCTLVHYSRALFLHILLLSIFSCCTFCRFASCCNYFMFYFFCVALFPNCTFSYCTLFKLHLLRVVHFSCCTFFCVALFSCYICFVLNFFSVALFSYCTIFKLHIFCVVHFSCCTFLCCTFLFPFCTLFMLHLFSCCSFFVFYCFRSLSFHKHTNHRHISLTETDLYICSFEKK